MKIETPGMKVLHTELSFAHAPRWYVADGTVRPCPECPERYEAILGALTGVAGLEVARAEPAADVLAAIRAVHHADYLEYLAAIYPAWSAEFGDIDVFPDTFVPPHRRGLLTRPSKPAAQAGYYCVDLAAPIGARTFDAAVASAGCALAAAEAAIAGAKSAYALCRPPGHHAGPNYCGGFCYLNNTALAAQFLREKLARPVAILDVDYHHGNGTQDIFYDRNDVLFVSLHAEPDTQYPYFWGHANERGHGPGEGCTINFPLPRGTGEAEWFLTLAEALMQIRLFAPAALVVSLGVDTCVNDGVGDFGLTPRSFAQLGRMVATLGLPTVWVQEGGYNLEQIGGCIRNTLLGFDEGG
jgi:acetoin utilization deacetylase AcuC-like enzyme